MKYYLFISILQLLTVVNLLAQDKNLVNQFENSLISDVLDAWYPKSLDTVYGGFLTNFNYKWEPEHQQEKMLVYQARQVWSTSKLYEFFKKEKFLRYSEHGYSFLREHMWDEKNGGFFLETDREGNTNRKANKSAYSNAFVIYALAAHYKVSNDSSALNLARQTFIWLEENSHDHINGGYFDLLSFDGSLQKLREQKNENRYNINPSWKDQNSSIHLLEAFTELYTVWPNKLLRKRLVEMLELIRDVIITEKGYLSLYLTDDWKPISFKDSVVAVREANYSLDHVSFGHDIETAFLLLEASHVLGVDNDENTLRIVKKLVDHSLQYGWDNENGGFYYEGYYFIESDTPKIINHDKVWWVQAEGLNSLLMMSKLFPTDEKYYKSFLQQWEYIKNFMIDHTNKGWYINGLDSSPEMITKPKAFKWKANYHNVRSLLNCIEMLRVED